MSTIVELCERLAELGVPAEALQPVRSWAARPLKAGDRVRWSDAVLAGHNHGAAADEQGCVMATKSAGATRRYRVRWRTRTGSLERWHPAEHLQRAEAEARRRPPRLQSSHRRPGARTAPS